MKRLREVATPSMDSYRELLAKVIHGKITGNVVAELDAANLRARKGDMLKALQGYQKVLEQVPFSAGVKYNLALALAEQNEIERTAETLELVFKDCVNYAPAYSRLSACYEHLGEQEKLRELRRIWGDNQEQESPVPTDGGDAANRPLGTLDEDDVWA